MPRTAVPPGFDVAFLQDGERRHVPFRNAANARSFFERMSRINGIAFVELTRIDRNGVEILAQHFADEGEVQS